MKNELIEKYISENLKGWSPDRGSGEVYDEIVDFIEEKMGEFEMVSNEVASPEADLKRAFKRLDASWEVFKRDLNAMVKNLKKVGY